MTEKEACKLTIDRWVKAAKHPNPTKFLVSTDCALCEYHHNICMDCMIKGKGICTVLHNGTIRALFLKDKEMFEAYALAIVNRLWKLYAEMP